MLPNLDKIIEEAKNQEKDEILDVLKEGKENF